MRVEISKEWCERMAKMEDGAEIGAGLVARDPALPLGCDYCKSDEKALGPGWIKQPNNGPIQSCPICNPEGRHLVTDF